MKTAYFGALISILSFQGTLVHSQSYYGEPCNPLIPAQQCISQSSLTCQQAPGSTNFTCHCTSGSLPNAMDGKCSGTYEELCTLDGGSWACNTDRGMRCYTSIVGYGHCYCRDESSQTFNQETESCVSLVGTSCDPQATPPFGSTCVSNAFCDPNGGSPQCRCSPGYQPNGDRMCIKTDGHHGARCETNAGCDFSVHHLECREGFCACAQGYSQNSTGMCARHYDQQCSSLDPCNTEKYFRCSSHSGFPGKCRCATQDWQVYQESQDACAVKIGYECDGKYGMDGIQCIDNAVCNQGSVDNDKHLCGCEPEFVATHDRFCRPRTQYELGDACDASVANQCAEDTLSECLLQEDGTSRCACPSYRAANKDNIRCYKRHGEYCHDPSEIHCNTDRHLECDNIFRTCKCSISSNRVWDHGRDSCVALVGGHCTLGDQGERGEFDVPCVKNADCVWEQLDTGFQTHRCRCGEGFEESANRTCTAA